MCKLLIRLHILLTVLTVMLTACGKKAVENDDSTALSLSDSAVSGHNLSPMLTSKLQQIIVTEEGVFRGVYFGMPLEKVQEIESKTTLKKTGNHIYATLALDDSEPVEIAYYLDENNTVSRISADIYSKNNSVREELQNEFIVYFDKKYGTHYTNEDGYHVWSLPSEHYATLAYFTETDQSGIELEFR